MGFFEPIPEPEPAPVRERHDPGHRLPPEWLAGPPDRVGGGVVPFRQTLFGDDNLVVRVDRVLVYKTGLMIQLELHLADDHLDERHLAGRFPWGLTDADEVSLQMQPWQQSLPAADYFRFGVRYADGRLAATSTWEERDALRSKLVDSRERPDGLVLLPWEGSSGRAHASVGLWIWPAPPEGPVELAIEWPGASVPQTITEIPADALEHGRGDVTLLW